LACSQPKKIAPFFTLLLIYKLVVTHIKTQMNNFYISFILLFSLNIYSQCEIDRFEDEDIILQSTNREIIEDLIEYENGFLVSTVYSAKGKRQKAKVN